MRTWSILLAVSLFLLILIEGVAWLLMGAVPLDTRYQCAARAPAEHFTIFSYGGSTVYGTPVPEYGFMAQLDAAVNRAAPGKYSVCNMGEGGRDSTGVLLDIEKTLQYKPDLIIVLSGHNEFLQPVFDSTVVRRWRERITRLSTIRLFNKLIEKIAWRLNRPAVQQALPETLEATDRNGADFQARVARYESNVEGMVQAAEDAGIPMVFGTLTNNLDQWAPVFKKIPVGSGGVHDEQAVSRVLELVDAGDFNSARRVFDGIRWTPEESQAAIFKYLEAQFTPNETEDQQTTRRKAFLAVRDADPIPWRVLTRFNDHVRKTAQGKKGLTLVDVEELLGEAAGDGVPGYDLVADNCHPTPRANYFIARGLLDAVEPLSGAKLRWTEIDSSNYISSLTPELGLEYLLRNGIYVMKVPFFNYAASQRYLQEARRKWPADWRSWANLASIELLVGDVQLGKNLLRKALSLQPDRQLYLSHQHSPYLKEALAAQGLSFEMILEEAPIGEPTVEQKVEPTVEPLNDV